MGPVNQSAEPATPAVSRIPTSRSVVNRIARASAVYGSSTFVFRALSLLLLPLYTHYLTPADYGIVALAEILALALITSIGLGFEGAMQRLYFQHVDRPQALASYIGSALKFALASQAVFLAIVLGAGP